MYKEENILIRRVKKLNVKTSYFKSKRIIHLEGEALDNNGLALRKRLESLKNYSSKYGLNFEKQLNREIK